MNAIIQNQSLKAYNTFGIDVKANYFAGFNSTEGLRQILASSIFQQNEQLILGGGSNILFTKNFEGIVLHNLLKGISKVQISDHEYHVTAAAGEVWHELVLYAIDNNLGGIENLSLIPGFVGASPMQNIGAYGVEIKDIFVSLKAIEVATGSIKTFTKEECQFGYRESFFKREGKGKFIILEVTFQLSSHHQLNTSYGAIEQELNKMNVLPSIKSISQAVINIRSSKLPNPKDIGNAGSFFKNPTIAIAHYETLKKQYPDLPGYPVDEKSIKTAAGYLIEKCGLKGFRNQDAGVHQMQALVLVNYGKASGHQIFDLSNLVIEKVLDRFGIELEREVNIY
ncbi:MAG TPA: UDP-N-acetylmuramate dehydrogenase [Bacteroidia bacterium]|nr:UDP-N-acetylmuramate dehydrogenase [Bacteroidia bacterium]